MALECTDTAAEVREMRVLSEAKLRDLLAARDLGRAAADYALML
jgi:hypothetical protein